YTKNIAFSSFPYWSVLVFAVGLKFLLYLIQSPTSLLPGGEFFSPLLTFSSNLLLMIILIKGINNMYYIKAVVWAFGIGASLSTIIPFIFFPEMIGSRISLIDDFTFTGAFWNSSVIS